MFNKAITYNQCANNHQPVLGIAIRVIVGRGEGVGGQRKLLLPRRSDGKDGRSCGGEQAKLQPLGVGLAVQQIDGRFGRR